MKTWTYSFAIMSGVCCGVVHADETGVTEKLAHYRQLAQEYGDTLKQELTTAIKSGGALAALDVCHVKAPQIASQISEEAQVHVARTSLKVRNVNSAPDAWEESVLKAFEIRKASGEDPNKLEFHAVVEKAGKRELRYMKAISTAEICLNCHGNKIEPTVQNKILELYPQDKAVGFKIEELRGAFSLRETLVAEKQ